MFIKDLRETYGLGGGRYEVTDVWSDTIFFYYTSGDGLNSTGRICKFLLSLDIEINIILIFLYLGYRGRTWSWYCTRL